MEGFYKVEAKMFPHCLDEEHGFEPVSYAYGSKQTNHKNEPNYAFINNWAHETWEPGGIPDCIYKSPRALSKQWYRKKNRNKVVIS
jgi:hypothetical protein